MVHAVIDPGVLVAALISSKGAPRLLLRAWLEGSFELVVSPALMVELERVLDRDKFRRYVSVQDAKAYVALFRRFATVATDVEPVTLLCRDPEDEYLLALAMAHRVNYLVSGDPHLTSIKNPPIPIVSPRAFVSRLAAGT